MTEITQFEDICNKHNLRKIAQMSPSAKPTYLTDNGLEGLQLFNKKVEPFWVKGGERVPGEAPSEALKKVLDEFGISNGKQKQEEKKEPEKNHDITIIPEVMSASLLEKWKKMSTFDRMLMFQRTAKEHIEMKPISKDGTVKVPYVTGNVMFQEANIAFLFEWESKIDKVEIGDTAVCVYGSITVTIDGKKITRSCVGDQEINAKTTKYLAVKGAHTDMIKKGLSMFGFNSDVYRGDV